MKSRSKSSRGNITGSQLLAALKSINRKLQARLAKCEAENISLKNEIAALKRQLKKGAFHTPTDLAERLRRARERVSKAT